MMQIASRIVNQRARSQLYKFRRSIEEGMSRILSFVGVLFLKSGLARTSSRTRDPRSYERLQ